jgi:aspartyl-tRNA(Asn)/glutamyl-tRNA(Gln) amidotransferase subunit A
MELYELGITELAERLRKGEADSVDAVESLLSRIDEVDPKIHAYLHLDREGLMEAARKADAERADGKDKPLLGVPLGIKDIFLTKDIPTTAASRILENYLPTYDSTAVARLKNAGAIIAGKLNMDEFAMGSSNEKSGFMPTHNPWDLSRIPGGSSGANAAATAVHGCFGGLGTDTGGSIRQPASCCGVVGIKPTYGRVSRYGVIAFASSLDQVGPITKNVSDAALLLKTIAGHDPLDSTSVRMEVPDYTASLNRDIKGMKVGMPQEFFAAGLDPGVEKAVREAVKKLEDMGAEVGEVSLPHTQYCVACYYIIAPAEASANLARYDGARYGLRVHEGGGLMDMYKNTRDRGFGAEVKRRILIGTYTLSAGYYDQYYLKACRVRSLIKQDFDRAFEKYDVLVAPTIPTPPFKQGEKTDDPLAMYMLDVLTLSCNLAGLPGMTVPCGFSDDGLPTGLQILAGHFNEEAIFRLAHAYEQATAWHTKSPEL